MSKRRKRREWRTVKKKKMAGFEVIVTSKSQSQAVFIEAVVMPEIAAVLEKYKKDIIELGKEQ